MPKRSPCPPAGGGALLTMAARFAVGLCPHPSGVHACADGLSRFAAHHVEVLALSVSKCPPTGGFPSSLSSKKDLNKSYG